MAQATETLGLNLKVTVTPSKVEAGETVKVTVEIENYVDGLTYTVRQWEVEGGRVITPPPKNFGKSKTLTAQWSTTGMMPGDHGVTVHVLVTDGKTRREGSESALVTVVAAQPKVTLDIDVDCKGEVHSVRQGQLLCVTAELENPQDGLEYGARFETQSGAVGKVDRISDFKWRALISTEDLAVGLQAVKVWISVKPKITQPVVK